MTDTSYLPDGSRFAFWEQDCLFSEQLIVDCSDPEASDENDGKTKPLQRKVLPGLLGILHRRNEDMIYYVDANSAITGSWYLKTNLAECLQDTPEELITTETLGEAFEPEQPFENPDGTPIVFDTDYFGSAVGSQVICGPFADRSSWENEICVWQDQM